MDHPQQKCITVMMLVYYINILSVCQPIFENFTYFFIIYLQ